MAINYVAAGRPPGVSSIFGIVEKTSERAYSWLLLLRFGVWSMITTIIAAAILYWDYTTIRFFEPLWTDPATGISCGIIAVLFLGCYVRSVFKFIGVSDELNQVHSEHPRPTSRAGSYLASIAGMDAGARANMIGMLEVKLDNRLTPMRSVVGELVTFGLIGTVIGFILALEGVDPTKAADVSAIMPMVAALLQGMYVALYTTLVGGVLSAALQRANNLLEEGVTRLFTSIVERGEREALERKDA